MVVKRRCCGCWLFLDLNETNFYRKGFKKDGSPQYRYRCKVCDPDMEPKPKPKLIQAKPAEKEEVKEPSYAET